MTRTLTILLAALPLLAALVPARAASVVPLSQGLAFTSTQHMSLTSSAGSLAIADTEVVYSVTDVQPDKVSFAFYISAPQDTSASNILAKVKNRRFERDVNRTDLQSAARLIITFSSDDPRLFPGQTFAGTSAAVLQALSSQGQVPFVLGVNEPDQGLGAFAGIGASLAKSAPAGGIPANIGGFMMSLGVSRHYYRGTLKRVGTADEPFSVLLNGKRTTVPALHGRGDLTFVDKTMTYELWWLDDPGNPMTLKWLTPVACAGGACYEIVTRIDYAAPGEDAARRGGGGGGGAAAGLTGKDCRSELSGVYFTTASAEVLEASLPALRRFAALMVQHPDWVVTVEGHTDNIGSAEYNMDLSTRRANAVREVLISQLKVPANRLLAKGYGLTRPVETNATDEGRAHNRRVEVSRSCH
jgi:outer membrane protein OmpA-like peptidoglycan-associated protein